MYVNACLKLSVLSATLGAPGSAWRSGRNYWYIGCRKTMPTRIILADDHALVRQGIKSLLEREGLQVVAEASDGREAIQHAEALCTEVLIMDIVKPTVYSKEADRELAKCCHEVEPILRPLHDDPQ